MTHDSGDAAAFVRLAPEIFVCAADVVSVERDTTYTYRSPSPSDTNPIVDFDGSRITLKNGRKVFVRDVFPEEIMEKLGLLKLSRPAPGASGEAE